VHIYKYVINILAVSYFIIFTIILNLINLIYNLGLLVVRLPAFLWDIIVFLFFKLVSAYYMLVINLLRRYSNNFIAVFFLHLLTVFLGVCFFLEILYIFSPFIARGIIYFYNPFTILYSICFSV
jgi:hypothetical protein